MSFGKIARRRGMSTSSVRAIVLSGLPPDDPPDREYVDSPDEITDPFDPRRQAVARLWELEELREGDDPEEENVAIDCPNCGVVTFAHRDDYVCIVCRANDIPSPPE